MKYIHIDTKTFFETPGGVIYSQWHNKHLPTGVWDPLRWYVGNQTTSRIYYPIHFHFKST